MNDRPPPNGGEPHPPIDGAELLAHLLGELPPEASARIDAALAADPALQAEAERLDHAAQTFRDTLQTAALDEDGTPLRMSAERRRRLIGQLGEPAARPAPLLRFPALSTLIPIGLAAGLALAIFGLLPGTYSIGERPDRVSMVDVQTVNPPALAEPPPPPQMAESSDWQNEPDAFELELRPPSPALEELEQALNGSGVDAYKRSPAAPARHAGELTGEILEDAIVFEYAPAPIQDVGGRQQRLRGYGSAERTDDALFKDEQPVRLQNFDAPPAASPSPPKPAAQLFGLDAPTDIASTQPSPPAHGAETSNTILFRDGTTAYDLARRESSLGGDEDVIELSPFCVEAENDVGYTATQTLAGSRIRINVPGSRPNNTKLKLDFDDTEGTAGGSLAESLQFSAGIFNEDLAEEQPVQDFGSLGISMNDYVASNSTLATTRLRTDLRDIPASITVVSHEFLEDTAATDYNKSLLTYTTNTEVSGTVGRFAPDLPPAEVSKPETERARLSQNLTEGLLNSVAPAVAPTIPSESDKNQAPPAEDAASPETAPDSDLRVYPEIETTADRFSTFSLNVSDTSFRLAQSALARAQLPRPGTLRTEEFINAFDYRDPAPRPGQAVALSTERARWPFAHHRELLRLSLQTAATGRLPSEPLNLVLVLDTSGSMARPDREGILTAALEALATKLQPSDRLSIVAFSRTPTLLFDGETGQTAEALRAIVAQFNPQGGTHLEEALRLAYATAHRHALAGGLNRLVLLTDGATNLGETAPEALARMVEDERRAGISLDVFGVGFDGHNDVLLERLARHGDGRYRFLRHQEDARQELGDKLAGILHPAAYDVKVQVEFNPQRVRVYQQLGYQQHQIRDADFRNNAIDAAELADAEAGTALYLIEPIDGATGPLGVVRIRYRDAATGEYLEHSWNLPSTGEVPALEDAPPSMRLAATAVSLAALLNQSPLAADITPEELTALSADLSHQFPSSARVRALQSMLARYRQLSGRP